MARYTYSQLKLACMPFWICRAAKREGLPDTLARERGSSSDLYRGRRQAVRVV